jgi:hypothetical protein
MLARMSFVADQSKTIKKRSPANATVAIAYIASAFVVLLYYSPALLPDHALRMGDYITQNVPNRAYATFRLRQGALPQWTDALFCGFPFLSDPQTGVFYPPNLLLAAITSNVANSFVMDRFCIAHVLLLAFGMVFLARSIGLGPLAAFTAAIIVSLNGYIVSHFGHVNIIQAISWSPLVFGAWIRAERHQALRWAVAGGLMFACVILAGHPQIPMHASYAILLATIAYSIHRRKQNKPWKPTAIRTLLLLSVGIGISLIQILPTLEITRLSNRSKLSMEEALHLSTPLRQLPYFLMPGLYQPLFWNVTSYFNFDSDLEWWGADGSWEHSFFLGITAFALGVFGWYSNRKRFTAKLLGIATVVCILMALGRDGLIYPIAYRILPGFHQVRIPPRILWLFFIAWALLAGMGIERLQHFAKQSERRNVVVFLLSLGVIFAGALVTARVICGSWNAAYSKCFVLNGSFDVSATIGQKLLLKNITQQIAIGGALLLSTCAILWFVPARGSAIFAVVAVVLSLVELFIYGFHKNIGGEDARFNALSEPAFAGIPEASRGRALLIAPQSWIARNTALVSGQTQYASGYNPIHINWLKQFLPGEQLPSSLAEEKMYGAWDVKWLVASRQLQYFPLNGRTEGIPMMGWATLERDRNHRSQIAWKTTHRNVTEVTIVCARESTGKLPDGTVIGVLRIAQQDGTETTVPLVLGKNMADAEYQKAGKNRTIHSLPPSSFAWEIYDENKVRKIISPVTVDLLSSAPVTGVAVTAISPPPAQLIVATVILRGQKSSSSLSVPQTLGYKRVPLPDESLWALFTTHTLGKAWMVPTAEAVSYRHHFREVQQVLGRPDFDPKLEVIVDAHEFSTGQLKQWNATSSADFRTTVTTNTISPEHMNLKTTANKPGWLVISHSYYPGWTATVDKKPAKLAQANGAQLAVHVPAGYHSVDLKYRTPFLITGAIASGITWLCAIALLLLPGRKELIRGRPN